MSPSYRTTKVCSGQYFNVLDKHYPCGDNQRMDTTSFDTNAGRILYTLAEQADRRYSATVYARTGKTRWTMTRDEERIPEVRDAYLAKVRADEAWLSYLWTNS